MNSYKKWIAGGSKLLVFGFLFSSSLNAQVLDHFLFMGGKVGGHLSLAHFSDGSYLSNNAYTSGIRRGWESGISMDYVVTKKWSFKSEILFSRRNIEVFRRGDLFVSNRLEMGYLELPILMCYGILTKRDYALYFNFGPNVSYWMYGNGLFQSHRILLSDLASTDGFKYEIGFKEPDEPDPEDTAIIVDTTVPEDRVAIYNPGFQRIQWGIDAGFSFHLPIVDPFKLIIFDLRYTLGQSFLGRNPTSYRSITTESSPFLGMIPNWEASQQILHFSIYMMIGFPGPAHRLGF
ncbi:MAG: outer membrane beta-barrel protein [Cytophagales bacterium]|nr:outer membrane beta-barrel protein [Cytophagales bacterium]